jgi:PAS domain S-box-containing protein
MSSDEHHGLGNPEIATYKTIADKAPLGIIVIQDDQVLFANSELAKLIGFSLTDLHKMTANDFIQFVAEADKFEADRRLKSAVGGEIKTKFYDIRIKDKERKERWLQVLPRGITIGKKPAILAMVAEITEVKRIEHAYRELVDHSLQGLIIIQEMRVVFTNQAFADISGYTIDEILALSPEEVQACVHPDYQARVWGRMRDRLDGKPVPSHYQFKAIRKDGSERWLEMFVIVIEFNGKPAVQASFLDITERQEADTKLQESEARYRGLFDELPIGLYRTTIDGNIIDANPALVKLLGAKDKDTLLAMNASDFYVHRRERQQYEEILGQEGIVTGHDVEFKRLDGKFIWVRDSFRAIRDSDGAIQYYEGSLEDITERRKAEQALKERERRYRALFERTNDAVFIISLDMKHLEANQQATELLGYTLDELIGMPVDQIVAKGEYKDSKRVLKALLAGDHVPVYERIFVKKSGEEFPVEINAALVTDTEGNPIHIQSVARDITERKEAELALRESEEKYRSLIETSPDAITVIDLEGKIQIANPQAVRQYGAKSETDLIGSNAFKLVGEEDYDQVMASIPETLQTGVTTPLELKVLRIDGSTYPAEINFTLLRDNEGNPYAFLAIIRDISERKQAELALKESEEKYRTLVETSPDAITVTDLEGKVIMVNRQALQLYGVDNEKELIGISAFELISPADIPLAMENMQKTLERGTSGTLEYNLLRRDGTPYPAELNATLLKDADGNPMAFIGVIRDISERKEAEARYRHLFDSVPVGLFRTTPDGTILNANPALVEMLGFDDKEPLLKRKASSFYTDPQARKQWEAAVRREDVVTGILAEFKRIDGELIWVELSARAIRDKDGNVEFYEGTLEDITARKRSEDALKESEAKYRALIDQSLQGIVIFQDNQLVFVNPQISELIGIPSDELLKRTPEDVWNLIDAEDREIVQRRYQSRLQGEKVPDHYELRVKSPDGRPLWMEVGVKVIEYQGRSALQITLMDVTERKRANQAIQESEEKYRTLVEQSLFGIVISRGPPLRIFFANEAFAQMLGYTVEEILAMSPKKIKDLIHPADQEMVIGRAEDRLIGKDVLDKYEYRMVTKDGIIRWVQIFAHRIEYEGEPAVQAAYFDITERKEAEAALQESEERFRALVEDLSDWVWEMDISGKFVYTNNAVEDILGFSAGQVLGRTPCDFLRSEDVGRAQNTWAELKESQRPIRTLVIQMVHRDESDVILEARGRPVFSETNQLLGFRGICRDITDRLKMLEQLRELDERL